MDTKIHTGLCDKIHYSTHKEAMAAIRGIVSHSKNTKKMKVYKCPDCRAFHITTQATNNTLRKVKDLKYPLQIKTDRKEIKMPKVNPVKYTQFAQPLATFKLGELFGK